MLLYIHKANETIKTKEVRTMTSTNKKRTTARIKDENLVAIMIESAKEKSKNTDKPVYLLSNGERITYETSVIYGYWTVAIFENGNTVNA